MSLSGQAREEGLVRRPAWQPAFKSRLGEIVSAGEPPILGAVQRRGQRIGEKMILGNGCEVRIATRWALGRQFQDTTANSSCCSRNGRVRIPPRTLLRARIGLYGTGHTSQSPDRQGLLHVLSCGSGSVPARGLAADREAEATPDGKDEEVREGLGTAQSFAARPLFVNSLGGPFTYGAGGLPRQRKQQPSGGTAIQWKLRQ